MAHYGGGYSYLLEDCVCRGFLGFGILNEFAIVDPVGALDVEGGLRQVAAEDCRGLVADLRGFGNDVWSLR